MTPSIHNLDFRAELSPKGKQAEEPNRQTKWEVMSIDRRIGSALVLGLLIVATGVLATCSNTTTPNTVASEAPTTAGRTDTTGVERRSSATTGPEGTGTGGTPRTAAERTTTSRRSTSSTSGGSQMTTITSVVATPGNEAFCDKAVEAINEAVGALNKAATAMTGDAETAKKAFDDAILEAYKPLFQKLTDAAPAQIKPDFEMMNDIVQKATDYGDLAAAQNQDELEAASKRVESYMKDNCGITIM